MNIFLDDERNPSHVTWVKLPIGSYKVIRSYEDFVAYILDAGIPNIVSFDHDLSFSHYGGDYTQEKTGYDALKWMLNYCSEFEQPIPTCYFHSMNPVGCKNMKEYYEMFCFRHKHLM